MSRRFTQLMLTFTIFALALTMISNQANAERKILLEQFTGAWCGWCVDGSLVMDSLLNEFPDDLIGVKIHQGDPMELPDFAMLQGILGITGFPTGAIDREIFNVDGSNIISIPRNVWRMGINALLDVKEEKVTVSCEWHIDYVREKIVANLHVEFLAQMTEDVRLNVYVCEDNITGGSDYDQANAYAKRMGQEYHPYYNEPAIISGYVHKKVVRLMAGGVLGEKGPLPGGILSGNEYDHTFEIDIDPMWNLDEVYLLGVVQKAPTETSQTRMIYNTCYADRLNPTTTITSNEKEVAVRKEGKKYTREFTIKNVSDEDITYLVDVQNSERTPEGWVNEIVMPGSVLEGKKDEPLSDEVTINAGESVKVSVSMTPQDNIGIGDVYMTVSEKDNADAISNASKLTLVSGEIESFEILDDDDNGIYSINAEVRATERDQYFPLSSRVFLELYQDLKTNKQIKYLIWNTGNRGGLAYQEADKLSSLLSDNIGLLITGALAVPLLKANYPSNLLLGLIGLDWNPDTDQIQNVADFTLKGVKDDPITDGLMIPNCSRAAGQTYYLQELRPLDTDITKQMLEIQNYYRYLGFRTQTLEYRIAVFSFNFPVLTDVPKRRELLDKTLTWLEEMGDMPKALVSKSKINFGRIEINKEAQDVVEIENIGGSDLIIEDIYMDWNDDNAYTINKTAPQTVAPGEKLRITITFKPPFAGQFKSFLNVKHNAKSYAEAISLEGIGGEAYDGPKLTVDIEDNELSFGEVEVGSYKNEIIVMRNIGSDILTLYDVAIINDPDKVYSLVGSYNNTEIPSKGAKNLTVKFQPKEKGKVYDQGQIIIQSDDVEVSQLFIYLNGKGAIEIVGPEIATNATDGMLNFGDIDVGGSSTMQLEIQNSGDQDLIISQIELTDQYDVFEISGQLTDVTLPAGETHSIDVTFSGSTEGEYSGIVNIKSNAVNANSMNVMLSGTIGMGTDVKDGLPTAYPLSVELYPNPSDGNFSINYLNNSNETEFNVTISDASGRVVQQMSNKLFNTGFGVMDFDCSSLSSGNYILLIESNGISAEKQVVIVK
jgi:hypothetical protein